MATDIAIDPLVRNNVTVSGNLQAGKTIVFVNGLGCDQHVWQQVTPAFAADYRLVLFDNVGAIASNQEYFSGRQYRYLNVNGYALDLLEICRALRLQGNTIVVGHSLGAMAALLASIQKPALFSNLVLIGASPRYSNADDYQGGFSNADIDATYAALQRDQIDWSRNFASVAMGTPDRPALAEAFAEALARIPHDMILTVLCSLLQMDHRSDLPKVSRPTLLIQSQEDNFVPRAVADYMQAHIPDCRLSLIDAVGHLPHVIAPDKVIAAMLSFIG